MPAYDHLDRLQPPERRRTIERLLDLRRSLDAQVPRRSAHQLLVATWNIREFDSAAYGRRSWEPLYYIAEIVAHFDLIALAEVRADLDALERLMLLLGPHWDYLLTDVTAGRAGNDERLAVLYDRRTVAFGGLAGELVLPPIRTTDESGRRIEVPAAQFARTPLLAGFTAGWTRFMVGVLHVKWGDGVEEPREELRMLAEHVSRHTSETPWAQDLLLLGDFNIGSPDDTVWHALRNLGWTIPPDFVAGIRGTNIAQNKFYDQIAVAPRPGAFELTAPGSNPTAGVVNFFDTVYRPIADYATYVPTMERFRPTATRSNFAFDSRGQRRTEESRRRWYRDYWRTHQMSDHLPLWVSLRSDYTDSHLAERLGRV